MDLQDFILHLNQGLAYSIKFANIRVVIKSRDHICY